MKLTDRRPWLAGGLTVAVPAASVLNGSACTGGDNSDLDVGEFIEGAVTAG